MKSMLILYEVYRLPGALWALRFIHRPLWSNSRKLRLHDVQPASPSLSLDHVCSCEHLSLTHFLCARALDYKLVKAAGSVACPSIKHNANCATCAWDHAPVCCLTAWTHKHRVHIAFAHQDGPMASTCDLLWMSNVKCKCYYTIYSMLYAIEYYRLCPL